MSLIKCFECGHEVSDRALACPKCACPIGTAQTIEKTAKRWKSIRAAGAILAFLGFLLVFGVFGGAGAKAVVLAGTSLLFLGLIAIVGGCIGGWWYHG